MTMAPRDEAANETTMDISEPVNGSINQTAMVAAVDRMETIATSRTAEGIHLRWSRISKVVDLSKAPKSLNINCGDVISFRDGDKTFTWKFDVVGHQAVKLAAIAPAGFNAQAFTVYVSRNDSEGN